MLTLNSQNHDYFFNNLKRTSPHGVNFRIVSGISRMSWAVVLAETINNGLKVMFILMSLAGGVALPMLLTRKESAKHIRFRNINEDEFPE